MPPDPPRRLRFSAVPGDPAVLLLDLATAPVPCGIQIPEGARVLEVRSDEPQRAQEFLRHSGTRDWDIRTADGVVEIIAWGDADTLLLAWSFELVWEYAKPAWRIPRRSIAHTTSTPGS